jgi:hypothetical protein
MAPDQKLKDGGVPTLRNIPTKSNRRCPEQFIPGSLIYVTKRQS